MLQDRATRPDLRILRATQNEVAGGPMGTGRSGAHHGRRVTSLLPCPKLIVYTARVTVLLLVLQYSICSYVFTLRTKNSKWFNQPAR